MTLPNAPLLLICVTLTAAEAWAANGIVYYSRFAPNTPATIRRIGGDGAGDQDVALNLPEPTHPTLSRSGRFLMATSRDPGRPFMLTRNVYLFDLVGVLRAGSRPISTRSFKTGCAFNGTWAN